MLRLSAALFLILLVLTPVLFVAVHGITHFSPEWFFHLAKTVLPSYLLDSAIVIIWAITISLVLGFFPAWLTYYYDFRWRGLAFFLQLLPLTVPPYIAAGIFAESLPVGYFSGSSALALVIGAGAAPYVFIFARISLARFPRNLSDAARSLGHGALSRFFRIYLPNIKGPILVSCFLVAAEALSEFGAADRLGVVTFSVGLYNQWFGLQQNYMASLLATILVFLGLAAGFLFFLLFFRTKPTELSLSRGQFKPVLLGNGKSILVHLFCLATILPGFLLPIIYALIWSLDKNSLVNLADLFKDTLNTLQVAGLTALFCLILTLILVAIAENGRKNAFFLRMSWIVLVNLFIPPMVLAFSFFEISALKYPFSEIMHFFGQGQLLIVFADSLRFLPFLLLPTMLGRSQIPSSMAESALILGTSRCGTFLRCILPNILPFLLAGAIIIFIEVTKELTLSLILQPFDYGSLSIHIHSYSMLHMTHRASFWVLCLVWIGLFPIWLLFRLLKFFGGNNA